MNWSDLKDSQGSSNSYMNFPPLMSDRRLFTNYETSSTTDARVKEYSGFSYSGDYREYLQKQDPSALVEFNYVNNFEPKVIKNDTYLGSDLRDIYLSRDELHQRKSITIKVKDIETFITSGEINH